MATNIITPSNSRSSQLADTDVDPVLLVTAGGYIVETRNGYPAYYANGGGAHVTVDGLLMAAGNIGALYLGQNESTSGGGGNTVDIGTTGQVEGNSGISIFGGSNSITNEGVIRGASSGTPYLGEIGTTNISAGIYMLGSGDNVTNSGTIFGFYGIFTSGGGQIENSSVITGLQGGVFAEGSETVTNSGTINGSIESFLGSLMLTNNGNIIGGVSASSSSDVASYIDNRGDITGEVFLGSGDDTIDNSGQMRGDVITYTGRDYITNEAAGTLGEVDFSLGDDTTLSDTLTNFGTLDGAKFGGSADVINNYGIVTDSISMGNGADTFNNSGTVYGYVDMGAGADIDMLTNSGTISNSVNMGAGNDVVDDALGQITGIVDLGTGNDTFTGGAAVDRVRGGAGNDTVDLGGGDDVYFAINNDGNDYVDGGTGTNTYNAAGATIAFTIDLDSGATSGGVGVDSVLNFENIVGGAGADTLTGSSGANRIDGGAGKDVIDGGAGDDRLIGNTGSDTITGGPGRDVMTGGSLAGSKESDTFVFADGDTGATSTTRDVITDFTDHGSASAPFAAGADTIDLHLMDANVNVAGDQAFSFNATQGAAFSGSAGSLIWVQKPAFALVMGDTNGDKVADFEIQLNGTHTLYASDFVL